MQTERQPADVAEWLMLLPRSQRLPALNRYLSPAGRHRLSPADRRELLSWAAQLVTAVRVIAERRGTPPPWADRYLG